MSSTTSSPQTTHRKTRVLIVDDHVIVRRGYMQLLSTLPQMDICGEADDVETALQLVLDQQPDLVLVDISLKNGHGLELCKQIRDWNEQNEQTIAMLVVSAHDEELYAERALHAGALGYLSKSESAERLLEAIQQVIAGKVFLSQMITDRVLARLLNGHYDNAQSPVESLSDRELEVFERIGQGLTTREVAANLGLSPKTIETYRDNLKQKLNLANASQLVRAAVQFVLEEQLPARSDSSHAAD